MDNQSKYQPVVGKSLIEILMFSMYSNSLIIYREYVQNAFDAIVEAARNGVLNSVKDGHVSITIDAQDRQIRIKDNGIGIKVSEAQKTLLNIADSHKDGIALAGQYGIGRLVGAKYCKRLVFKTSAKGEDRYTEVIFDNDLAQKIIHNKEDESTATQVVERITRTIVGEDDVDDHYFEVRMEDVALTHSGLLNVDKVSEYLREVAPIDFQMEFKNQLYNQCIPVAFKELNDDLNHIKLTINNEIDIRKRYGLNIEGTGDKISSLEFFKIEDPKLGLLGWGWYAITPFSKNIPSSDVNRGIRLRKRNIQIGANDLLNQYFQEARGNNYFYGEIHATHPNLRPNSSRDGLTHTAEAIKLYDYIREYFADLKKLYHLANEMKNLSRDIQVVGSKAPQTQEEKFDVQKKLGASVSKIEKIKEKFKGHETLSTASDKVISLYSDNIDRTLGTLPTDIVRGIQIQPTPQEEHDIPNSATQKVTEEPPTAPVIKDMFATLNRKFSPEQVKLIRQVFVALTQNFPLSQRAMFEAIKEKAIKQLSK